MDKLSKKQQQSERQQNQKTYKQKGIQTDAHTKKNKQADKQKKA